MWASAPSNYIDELHRMRIDNMLKEVREKFPEEYPIFLKIRAYYIKNQTSNITVYFRLTRLRTECRIARQLFGKPLTKLTKEEWERLSAHLYSMHSTRDAIVSAIHPLRPTPRFLGYNKETIKELFPYPSSMKARLSNKAPPPYVPGHILDKIMFAISDDVCRAFFCLMRTTGARIEEVTLLRRKNIIDEEKHLC